MPRRSRGSRSAGLRRWVVSTAAEVDMHGSGPPAWHQALAYALTGVRFADLGRQPRPDLDALEALLRPRLGTDVDPAELSRDHPIPADLAEGLGAAQLRAGVADLRRRLAGPSTALVAGDRPLTADERRLLHDVPPHHGG